MRREKNVRWAIGSVLPLLLAAEGFTQIVLWEQVGPPPPYGPFPQSLFPGKFHAGGDVNGDGIRDVGAGAPTVSTGATYGHGQAWVYSGADGTVLYTVIGTGAWAAVGSAVLVPGDLDGDGHSEFVTNAVGGTGMSYGPGPVAVFSGADGSLLYTVPGLRVGWSPLEVMDQNGDGVPDLVLGCHSCGPASTPAAGAVAVVSGVDGSSLQYWTTTLFFPAFTRYGFSVANVGDMHGDGTDDLIVGAPKFVNPTNVLETALSYAQVRSGADGAVYYTLFPNPPVASLNQRFGWSVAGGDLDMDGIPDLIVGRVVPGMTPPLLPGHSVFSGATGQLFRATEDFAGEVVRFLGDVDGDGFNDYLGGSIFIDPATMSNCVSVGGGTGCGRVDIFSGREGTVIMTLRRPGSGEFGHYAAVAGDVDGDDIPDVAVGDPSYPLIGLPKPGRLTMFSLRPVGVEVYGAGCAGALPQVPRIGVRGSPSLGAVVKVNLSKAAPAAPAILFLGLSNSAWGPTPLPLDLAPFGMPGCSLLAAADFAFPFVTYPVPPAPGRASMEWTIPGNPSLVGGQVFCQWIVLGGPGLAGSALTRGVRLQVF